MQAKTIDPVVDAWRRVREAGADDMEYLAAIEDFERAVPTTLRGVSLKRRLARNREKSIAQGDRLTWSGNVARSWYLQTIEQGLEQIPRRKISRPE